MLRLVLLAFMAFFVAAAYAADLDVSNGWIRLLPAGVPSAGYFELHNKSNAEEALVAASSPAFGEVMLHQTQKQHGHSAMMHVHAVAVPAGGTLVFKPGGYHLMLMKPTRELRAGDSVPVTLEFGSGAKVTAQFEVRGPSGH